VPYICNRAFPKYDETQLIPFDFDEKDQINEQSYNDEEITEFDKQLKGLLNVPPENKSE